jgi:hypothetical protein
MSNLFNFKKNVLFRENERITSFESDIDTILDLGNCVVVLVKHSLVIGNQNVFCVDYQKKQVWQISKPVNIHFENYFSAIYLREGELYAYNINGVEYHIDKKTGKTLSSQLIK